MTVDIERQDPLERVSRADAPRTPGGGGDEATGGARTPSALRDYIALTKPAINRMCLVMATGGILLANRHAAASEVSLWLVVAALLGTALAVASANALNMWLERDTDGLMKRTKDRPLPNGRISDRGALVFGVALGAVGVAVLLAGTNLLTALIGLFAIVSYVAIYTPLKRRSPFSLHVGAIPGAVPPLMGWTAVTGHLDAPALVLFGILFVWQIPHFIAIAIFRQREYEAAGIRTTPSVHGLRGATWEAVIWAALLIPTSLLLVACDMAGPLYATVVSIAGVLFLARVLAGFRAPVPARWARQVFVGSLLYLPILVAGLGIDVLL